MPLEIAMAQRDYAVVIQPLSEEDGGGFVALVPDLPGCMSDGETREEAARNATDAIAAWIDEATALGREIPEPSRRFAMA
jgi:predicted RNase H-like HicB family nuclease